MGLGFVSDYYRLDRIRDKPEFLGAVTRIPVSKPKRIVVMGSLYPS